MQTQALFSLIVFLIAYTLIISEKFNRSVIALTGATLLIITGILDQHSAIEAIDFNTIGLLVGMMVVVAVLKRTGIFEYLAIKTTVISKGRPLVMMFAFSMITAVVSALLDNVTTILLMLPVVLSVARTLNIDPIPLAIAQVIASNVGGTATLVGDPPNIMIGSATGLGFMDFLINLAPFVFLILMPVMLAYCWLVYRKAYRAQPVAAATDSAAPGIRAMVDFGDIAERGAITDRALLVKALVVLAITLAGFVLHQQLHLESATVALLGASLMLLISPASAEEVFNDIEWTTIFFFVGLFVLVGALEHTGVIDQFAAGILSLTNGEPVFTALLILWGAAIASAFIDNIPFTATMIPLIFDIGATTNIDVTPYWWALSLGACLGGNGTIIGASANVVAAGMLDEAGHELSYIRYFKAAAPITLITIVISMVYLLIFEL